jgi:hypothetical protein
MDDSSYPKEPACNRRCLFTIHDSPFTIPVQVIRYTQHDRALTFAVRVVPRASRSKVGGEHDGALRVRITAPPVEGAANRELARLLAKAFNLPQNAVEIISGSSSKNKIIRVHGADAARLEQLSRLK